MNKELKENSLVIVEVENEGLVAAGRTLAFPAPESTSIIALPERYADFAKTGKIKTLTVSGNSLLGIGLHDGDELICKQAFSKKEIGPNTICIVYIPALGEVVAKKIRFVAGELVLRSCNPDVPDIKARENDVDIRGVVIGLHRTPDEYGHFDRGYEPDFPF